MTSITQFVDDLEICAIVMRALYSEPTAKIDIVNATNTLTNMLKGLHERREPSG